MNYFTSTFSYTVPEPGHALCIQSGDVTLQQVPGKRSRAFLVRYGMQVKSKLSYSEAASELGACLMHQAMCNDQMHGDAA